VDLKVIGQRFASRREAMGASRALAARWSGLSADRVAEIEVGTNPVSAREFEALCRGLAVNPAALYRGEEGDPRWTAARFRSDCILPHPEPGDVRALAVAAEVGRTLAALLAGLGRPVALAEYRQQVAIEGAGRAGWRRGYALGERARGALAPESGPISDMEALLVSLGVHVLRVAFSTPDIDGASLWEPGAAPVILLNVRSRRVAARLPRRAVLAHELCHLLHDAERGADLTTRVSWTEGTGTWSDAVEVRARAFAPAFLAPPRQVRTWAAMLAEGTRAEPGRLLRSLARHWGLSFEGAAWHAKNVGLVEESAARVLLAEGASLPTRDARKFEHSAGDALADADGAATRSAVFQGYAASLVRDALDVGSISAGRAEELLAWQ